MDKVVDLKEFSTKRAVRRVSKLWRSRFPEELTSKTMLGDLSDKTILTLAQLGKEVINTINQVIMGVFNIRPGFRFESLPGPDKIKVLDASLFLIDQIRWESLSRIGWVEGYAAEKFPLVELILNFDKIQKEYRPRFPRLRETHPDYREFIKRRDIDGESMIRAMIPAALAAFGTRV